MIYKSVCGGLLNKIALFTLLSNANMNVLYNSLYYGVVQLYTWRTLHILYLTAVCSSI